MAKKKNKEKEAITAVKKPSLGNDLSVIKLPFNLYSGFSAVVEELENKEFDYAGIYELLPSTFLFKSSKRKEHITVNVTTENLLIKQFSEEDNKLKVIYVVKDSGRKFKIL